MSVKPLFSGPLPLFDRIAAEDRPVRYFRPRRLIVLACSNTKRPGTGTLPARERCNGPLWQTLRTADPHSQRAQVGIVSARYGFRQADTPIEDYDARLTRDLASAMIAGGMTTRWPRPRTWTGPDNVGDRPGVEITGIRHVASGPIDDVALVGGALYLGVMRAFLTGFQEMGCVAANAAVTEINGPIGFMRRDLRGWLMAPELEREVRPWGRT